MLPSGGRRSQQAGTPCATGVAMPVLACRFFTALLMLVLLAGCGTRASTRDAAYGLMDAIQHPPPGDRLSADLRSLVQAYAERALKAGPPEDISKLAGRITTEVLKATADAAPDQRKLIGMMVNETLSSAMAAIKKEMPSVEQTSAQVASALERSAGGVLHEAAAQVDQQALLAMAERTAGATVRGATEGLRAEMSACQGSDCGGDYVRATSRSVVAGAIEGVRQEAGLWLLALAFGLGFLLAGATAGIAHMVRHRHGT